MSQPMTPAAVHKQYDEAVTAFRRQITDAAARVAFGREADGFLRQCACGVWHADQGLTPLHVEYYNALYSKGNPVPTVLYWELASLVEEYDRFVLPGFFGLQNAVLCFPESAHIKTDGIKRNPHAFACHFDIAFF